MIKKLIIMRFSKESKEIRNNMIEKAKIKRRMIRIRIKMKVRNIIF